MNKIHKILALILITASYTATTLPMNRLARVVAKKSPTLAPKITPTLAAPQRRLLSAVPKIASLPNPSLRHPSLRQRYDMTLQPKFDDQGKQRTFARPYPWLPALGAAAALGLNMQREQAECLTVSYAIFHLDEDTILILINDIHNDFSHLPMAIDHKKQINQLIDYLKNLNGYTTHWIMEYKKWHKQGIINEHHFTKRLEKDQPFLKKLMNKAINLFDRKPKNTGITMNGAIYRAIMNETPTGEMQEGSLKYISFDLRTRKYEGVEYYEDSDSYWNMLSDLSIEKQQVYAEKQYQQAQQAIDQTNISPAGKNILHKILQNSIAALTMTSMAGLIAINVVLLILYQAIQQPYVMYVKLQNKKAKKLSS